MRKPLTSQKNGVGFQTIRKNIYGTKSAGRGLVNRQTTVEQSWLDSVPGESVSSFFDIKFAVGQKNFGADFSAPTNKECKSMELCLSRLFPNRLYSFISPDLSVLVEVCKNLFRFVIRIFGGLS